MPSSDKRQYGLKYNTEVHHRIVQAIKLGATYDMASKAGGVTSRTLRGWLADAKRNGDDSPFHSLRQDILTADGASGINALACVQKAAKDGKWQAAAWLLERKHGFRRDGVRELREHAVLPGNLKQHENEILAEVRRLRVDASQSGSYVSAATLMRMETEILTQKRAAEKAEQEATHANADTNDLLAVISETVDGMPRSMLDRLAGIIEDKRRRAS